MAEMLCRFPSDPIRCEQSFLVRTAISPIYNLELSLHAHGVSFSFSSDLAASHSWKHPCLCESSSLHRGLDDHNPCGLAFSQYVFIGHWVQPPPLLDCAKLIYDEGTAVDTDAESLEEI
jgi:hypothetical protein